MLANGQFRVQRTSGLLIPGFSKRLAGNAGCTYLWGVPIGRFRIEQTSTDATLRYHRWPVCDVLVPGTDGAPVSGVGLIFNWQFCTFKLLPISRP